MDLYSPSERRELEYKSYCAIFIFLIDRWPFFRPFFGDILTRESAMPSREKPPLDGMADPVFFLTPARRPIVSMDLVTPQSASMRIRQECG